MAAFRKAGCFIGICMVVIIPFSSGVADEKGTAGLSAIEELNGAAALASCLNNGRPTLAYFYYSVACSCTAVQCSLALVAIADAPELQAENEDFNFVCVDAFYHEEVDSQYNLFFIPAMIAYGEDGRELYRVEWDIDKKSVRKLVNLIKANDGH